MGESATFPQRKKQRWGLIAFFFFSGILGATWSSRIPDIQHKLHLTNAALGTLLFSLPVGLVSGLAVASWLIASFGAKKIMLWACLFCALMLSLAGLAFSQPLVMIAIFFMGLGRTIYNLAANTSAVVLQRQYQKPIIASFHGIWSLACFVAAGISTIAIIADVNPAIHFSAIALVITCVALAFVSSKSNSTISKERRPFFVKPDKYLFLLGLMGLCAMLCEGAMFDWSVNYFEKVVKAKKSFYTTGYLSFILSMATGRLIGDRIIHWLGAHRLLFINGLLLTIGFFTAATFPFVLPAAIGFALIGAGDSTLVPIIYLLAGKTTKIPTSYALSSVTLIAYTGFVISPLLIGNISQRFGMPTAFYILSGISLFIPFLSAQVKKADN